MKPQFIVKKRQSNGIYVCRGFMGTIRGQKWGKWVLPLDPAKFDSLLPAIDRATEVTRGVGLGEAAVFFRGKVVWLSSCSQCDWTPEWVNVSRRWVHSRRCIHTDSIADKRETFEGPVIS